MKKKARMPAPRGPGIIEKAMAEKWVRELFASAKRLAQDGEDPRMLVNQAGKVFYLVLGAAVDDKLDADLPDMRILRGACNALSEQASESTVSDAHRGAMQSGLDACWRLMQVLNYDSVVNQGCFMQFVFRNRYALNWDHFQNLLARL